MLRRPTVGTGDAGRTLQRQHGSRSGKQPSRSRHPRRPGQERRCLCSPAGAWHQYRQLPCTSARNRPRRLPQRVLSVSTRADPERPHDRVGAGATRSARHRAGSLGAVGRVRAAHAHQPCPDARRQRHARRPDPRQARKLRRKSVGLQKKWRVPPATCRTPGFRARSRR